MNPSDFKSCHDDFSFYILFWRKQSEQFLRFFFYKTGGFFFDVILFFVFNIHNLSLQLTFLFLKVSQYGIELGKRISSIFHFVIWAGLQVSEWIRDLTTIYYYI